MAFAAGPVIFGTAAGVAGVGAATFWVLVAPVDIVRAVFSWL
jgi:hypothetical protein